MSAPAKAPMTARRLALEVLESWDPSSVYAADLLASLEKQYKISPADRHLAQSLVLGSIRNLMLLDFWVNHLRGSGPLKPTPRHILRLGLLQLLILGFPDHAAVFETVALASPREKPVVNAILRRAGREKDELLAAAAASAPNIRFSLPKFLTDRWFARFGKEDAEKLCISFNEPSSLVVRVNRLKPDAAPPEGAEPVPGAPDFFRISGGLPSDLFASGNLYGQDPATRVAPQLLAPQPGETVLDACAAPGGKAGILAQLMGNEGALVATDPNPARLDRLRTNLKRLGATCAQVRQFDWTAPSPPTSPDSPGAMHYDRILLDVPCSNTGVLGRRVDARWRLTKKSLLELRPVQLAIVQGAVPLLKPGGSLVYSTCSLEPEENEEMVEEILRLFPDLALVEQHLVLPGADGGDGAFAALLRRADAAGGEAPNPA